MYTLDADYYKKEFENLDDLIQDVEEGSMDPNVEILFNGEPTGQIPWDFMEDYV